MRRSLTALAWIAWSLVALLAQAAAAERRVALVLGNSAYANSSLELVNPKYDAEDVAAALKGLGFEVLLETDVSKSAADKAIEKFTRMAVGADAALFFYAGHAVQHQGQNYLLPVDADVTDDISLHYQTVQVENVRAVLASSNGVKIMVLDACRNNPIAERLAKHAAAAPLVVSTGERTRGLERTDDAQGLIVAYATGPGDVALDGKGRNSPFTKAFLRRLNEPGLEIEMMFRRIAKDVDAATNGRQRPETYVSLVSEYYLNRNDRIAWEKIKTTEDVATLHDFLEHFPSSFYALEARYRLQALQRAKEDACRRDSATLAAIDPRDLGRIGDLMRATTCAAVKAAAGAEIAALQATLARDAELCRREGAELETLFRAGKTAEIELLRKSAKCPATGAAADPILRDLAAKAEAACARDRATFDAIAPRDAAAVRALLAKTPCDGVKSAAVARLDGIEAAIEAAVAREAELCRREKAAFDSLKPDASSADVESLRREANCPATIAAIDQKLREMAAAADAACARDNLALNQIGSRDLDALRGLAGRTSCAQIKVSARKRIQEIETRLAQEAQTCARDEAEWKLLEGSSDRAGVETLRQRIECPSVAVAIDRKLVDLKTACRRDQTALDAIAGDDSTSLRSFLARATCAEITVAAQARLDKIEAGRAQRDEACRREGHSLAALRERGADARHDLIEFRRQSTCTNLYPDIDAVLASLPPPVHINTIVQVRGAQSELRRIGCFDGRADGKLDAETREGVNRYHIAKGRRLASLAEIEVSDDFLSELKEQDTRICAPPVVAKPDPRDEQGKPAQRQKKEEVARIPPEEPSRVRRGEPKSEPKTVKEKPAIPVRAEIQPPRAEPKPTRQIVRPYAPQAIPQAAGSSTTRGGGSSPIGVGF